MKKSWLVALGIMVISAGDFLIDGNARMFLIAASHAQEAPQINSDSDVALDESLDFNPITNALCTTISGFSQTAQTLRGFFRLNSDVNAQGMVMGNASVDVWGRDSTWLENGINLHPVCDKFATDRLIMHISGEQKSLSQWEAEIEQAIDTVTTVFPFLKELDLMAVVGGPNGTLCPAKPGRKSFGPWIRASENHPVVNQAIANVVVRKTIPGIRLAAGPPLQVDSCSDYSDNKGHISNDAVQERIGAKLDELYFR